MTDNVLKYEKRRVRTMQIFKAIITNVLTALYQPFWFAIILSVLFMFVYKSYPSIKQAAISWISWLKTDSAFRRTFLLVFYIAMILFRTLLNRNMWANPLSDVIGVWWLYNAKGELTTECIENFALFIPFTVLLLWAAKERILARVTIGSVLWKSLKITFLFSFGIEMLQLLLRLGTWQLSDLFYNTLGGAVGGLIYYVGYKVKHR